THAMVRVTTQGNARHSAFGQREACWRSLRATDIVQHAAVAMCAVYFSHGFPPPHRPLLHAGALQPSVRLRS
ncbi:MAG: hypothetical protein KDJ27_13810, partial [Gammaproteobacteria bacterium]|nr:hypothetical protein [Gammaproteobacteria bacterium]